MTSPPLCSEDISTLIVEDDRWVAFFAPPDNNPVPFLEDNFEERYFRRFSDIGITGERARLHKAGREPWPGLFIFGQTLPPYRLHEIRMLTNSLIMITKQHLTHGDNVYDLLFLKPLSMVPDYRGILISFRRPGTPVFAVEGHKED